LKRVFECVLPGSDERDIARRWWHLPVGCILPLIDGGQYQLLFAGNPGGPAGPDVRDAVLRSLSPPVAGTAAGSARVILPDEQVGCVEFHVRASDWFAHHHDSDWRYNNVILHVVLLCDHNMPTLRHNGTLVPTCSLNDLPGAVSLPPLPGLLSLQEPVWPCHRVIASLDQKGRDKLLSHAGLLRFEQKAHNFVAQLHSCDDPALSACLDRYGRCILPALAEALAYGRDREFFRAVGNRLLGNVQTMPEPLGRGLQPTRLDSTRLRSLYKLAQQVWNGNLWQDWRKLLQRSLDGHILPQLRASFTSTGLSLARSDIIICNVVLPFAAAVALVENDALLFECAQKLYCEHPGLASNHVTRMMTRQLQLAGEPFGSCCQQGLHYIYQQNCREKRCATCSAGKWDI
jgi:Protein of unknown function (DUF2851)